MARTLCQALHYVVETPAGTVGDADLFGEEHLRQVMAWNSIEPQTKDACVHTIVEQQVARQPDAPAVCGWDADFTYYKLDQISGRLAHHLVGLGVGPEVLVPLCFEKSAWTIVAMLAVLKAGGACVALNPAHPIDRLQSIINDTAATVIITSPDHEGTFESIVNHVVAVDASSLKKLPVPENTWRSPVKPNNPGFVVFTSGSTGKPKGIILEHRALCTSAREHGAAMRIGPTSRVLQFAAYTFDVSIGEIFTTLMYGGCICVPSEKDRMENLAGVMNAMKVDWAYLTPTVATLLHPSQVALKALCLGGEALKQESVRLWAEHVHLVNIYGPAETTIWSTALTGLHPNTPAANIGRGIGALMWITDASNHDRLCPIGSVGELLIEGPILARGYLNDPTRTAKSFIENPVWIQRAGRIRRFYKTGDLVRYNSDGTLDFVGRKDTQVKLHGQRIELGEIEHHLKPELKALGVTDVAVEMVKLLQRPGDVTLMAFFATNDTLQTDGISSSVIESMPDSVRADLVRIESILAQKLPSYMLPSMYVPISRMPTTTSGKLDRRRLKELAYELSNEDITSYGLANVEKRAPSTEMEKKLQKLWGELLSLSQNSIGVDDNFFRFGGDSVVAMRLVAVARAEGIMLTVANIFRHPRLCDMAGTAVMAEDDNEVHEVLAPFALLKDNGFTSEDESRMQGLLDELASECAVDKATVQDAYPCTPLQEGLLALSVKQPGAYVAQNVYRLPSTIDLERFRTAWEAAVKSTDILRTRIVHTQSMGPLQVVLDESIVWHSAATLHEYLAKDMEAPVKYGDPLIRYALIEQQNSTTDDKNDVGVYFVWTAHHALYDGGSLRQILEKVAQLYAGATVAQHSSFNGFIKYLMETNVEDRDEYWLSQLEGASPPTFPSIQASAGMERMKMSLTYRMHFTDHTLSSSNITKSTLFRAAWAMVVARYSDTDDAVFGVTLTGRNASVKGIEKLIGPMITTVPMRIRLNHRDTVANFLDAVQLQAADMMSFEQTGLQNIRRLGEDAQAACDFRTLLVVQPRDRTRSEEGIASLGLEAVVEGQKDFHTYPLVVECNIEDDGVTELQVEYDSNVLSTEQLESVLHNYETAIQQLTKVASDSKMTISEIDILSTHDKSRIWSWNSVEPQALEACVHVLVERQVKARPSAVAVDGWDATFTYRELDQLSGKLAHHLVSLGIGPEVLVPLCFDKSAWTIVAMLAVLKAGGACVALNPAHPIDRLQDIIQNTAATVILTAPSYCSMFEQMVDCIVSVDDLLVNSLPTNTRKACSKVLPTNPGFVVFTSGSTGKPKGIVLEHRALCTSAREHGDAMRMKPSSRVLQFAAYTFDVSIGEIFTTLIHGGCVCVPSEYDRLQDLARVINDMQVNWAYLTPTVVNILHPSEVPTLKTLCLGGEAVKQENISLWAENVYLINIYGPAETTIWSTYLGGLKRHTSASNIGRGIGALMWVVDASNHNRLCPVGCVGELLIEGPILARGYLNDTQKTAAAFINDPAWLEKGAQSRRFYKTGDLVCYNPDGTLNFIGRKDTQVKFHGQRIEPAEIEYHLKPELESLGVTDVAVEMVRLPQRMDDTALMAFFTGHDTPDGNNDNHSNALILSITDVVRTELVRAENIIAQTLPPYMVPSMYVPLNHMPMTVSGKRDRRKLQELARGLSSAQLSSYGLVAGGQKRAPSTGIEKQLQSLWGRVLGLPEDSISADDSFFRLGGDSIRAMRLVAAARVEKITLAMADIFRSPRLCEMAIKAATVTEDDDAAQEPLPAFSLLQEVQNMDSLMDEIASQCKVNKSIVQDAYPCTPLQEGLLALSVKQPGAYLAQNVFRIPAAVDIRQFCNAWERVVQTIDILRTRIVYTQESGFLQVVLNEGIDWRSGKLLDDYLTADRAEPVKYGGPLVRYALIENGDSEFYFVWTAHHALYDGGSVPLILEKVARVYTAGELTSSPPFSSFVKYLIKTDNGARDAYWQSQLDGVSPPTFPAPQGASGLERVEQSLIHRIQLPSHVSGASITRPTVIRAAWAVVVARYSDTEDALFGMTLAGRNAPVWQIGEIVGPMITTVPVRIKLDHSQTVAGFLDSVQLQAADMMRFEHTGLQHIRRLGTHAQSACEFRNLLVVQPREQARSDLGLESIGLEVVVTPQADFHTYPLVVECYLDNDGRVEIEAQYDANIVPTEQMTRMLYQFENVIRQLSSESSNQIVGEVEVISSQDKLELLTWNSIQPLAEEVCVHEVFYDQVALRPEATAVCAWDANFTYRELNELSDRLAHHLIGFGVGPEVLVPLCFNKSAWTIVSMLAVLKAGGACVSLDPAHPKRRLEEIISRTKAQVIVAAPQNCHLFDGLVQQVVSVQRSLFRDLRRITGPVPKRAVSTNPAFVLFTSGSTGTPKGIVIEHGSFCTSAEAHGTQWHIGPGSRVLQFAAHTFDVSNADMFTTITRGGCVCVPSDHDRSNNLAGTICNMNVNWTFLTPTVARLLQPSEVPCLKTLVLGGEASTKDNIRTWASDVELIICYGPAECSIYCAGSEPAQQTSNPSNVGYAIGGSFWITETLNHDRLAPIGCVGELLIEGRIVARGYLHDEEKTMASFIENPSWLSKNTHTQAQRRLYKTGDLARYNADGSLSIIGRKDAQVKLRGQRIELGEIEHHIKLGLHALGVRNVIVEMIKPIDRPEDAYLAAFFSKAPTSESGSDSLVLEMSDELQTELLQLESMLSEVLPSYMVPSLYIPLKKMPMTASGKRDRRVLQAIAQGLSQRQLARYGLADAEKRVPSTDMEKRLQKLWEMVLRLEENSTGADDSFFRLGGDSIAAMRLVAEARTQRITLTVAEIFRYPRLFEMAGVALVEEEDENDGHVDVEPFALLKLGEFEKDNLLAEISSQCAVNRAALQDAYPCTPLQEGLLALSVRQPGAYVAQNVFRVPSTVDLERFRAAWEATVEATDILRTRIVYSKTSGVLQVVLDEAVSWQSATGLDGYLAEDQITAIHYGGPLTRYALISNTDGQLYFVWTVHHALYDGGSLPLILEQVANAYDGDVLISSPPFSRFISYVTKTEVKARDEYWHSLLDGASVPTFPAQQGRASYERKEQSLFHTVRLPSQNGSSITKSTVVRAAWAMIVARYSDTEGAVFGATLTGRNAPVKDMTKIIGPTITTVPVRVRLDSRKNISGFLEEVQRGATDMIPFEHTGLQSIRRLGPQTQSACEFRNLLVIQPRTRKEEGDEDRTESLGLEGVNTRQADFHTYPLVVECNLDDDAIEIESYYDINVISMEQMSLILHQFEHVLKQLNNGRLDDKETTQTIGDVQLFSTQDELQVWKWNSKEPQATEACMHVLFKQQMQTRPDAAAICAWDGNFTYQELNQLSEQLAHHLVGLGVGPEVLVPLCFDKSAWTIVAMLAVLKAGGACVALNPAHPIDRLKGIISDIAATVILTTSSYKAMFKNTMGHVIIVDRPFISSLPMNLRAACNKVRPYNPGFVVFTSGSTGKPKGIILEHRALCTSAREHGAAMRVGPTSRVLQFAAYTFDVSIGEIFTTLIHGGCVCVPSEQDRLGNLAGVINTMKVNWAYLTPTVATLIQPSQVPTLKTLSLGGEAVKQENVSIWADHVYLINIYGPAETTIWSTALTGLRSNTSAANIGQGIGALMWVVEASNHDRLCPIGCIGELLIEGPILARGYLNDPSKTATAFIDSPLWLKHKVAGRKRRLYKTGDLVRYNADGTMDFIGRKDTQVKLYGQRIELGEIEHHLKPELGGCGVTDVVVEMVTLSRRSGDAALMAFFTGHHTLQSKAAMEDAFALFISDIPDPVREVLLTAEKTLMQTLPSYMIPSKWIPVSHMPITVSGKLDRRKLREEAAELSDIQLTCYGLSNITKTAPSTVMEKTIQALWGKLLNLSGESIGAEDNFFRLGGDSITAMRLVAEAQAVNINLTVVDIFSQPTLCDMASAATLADEHGIDYITPPFTLVKWPGNTQDLLEGIAAQCVVAKTAIQDAYPCTPLQEGLLALSVKQPGAYLAQNAFQVPCTIDVNRFRLAWEATAKSLAILRTRIVYMPAIGSLQVVLDEDISWQSGTDLNCYLAEDREVPVVYGGPLIRYGIIQDEARNGGLYFVWTAHHAIYDGGSLPMILDKVAQAYKEPLLMPSPSPSFNRFIEYLAETDDEARDNFWRSQLMGASPPAFPVAQEQIGTKRLEKSMIHKIELSSHKISSSFTRSTIIRAAWAVVVARYSDIDEAVFGVTLSGRNAPVVNMADIVGPTITTVPVRIRLDLKETVMDFLKSVQSQATDMVPFEHTGLQHIKRLGDDVQAACDFQNLLVVQPRAQRAHSEADGTSLRLESIVTRQADFHTYPLVTECNLGDDSIEVEVHYDSNVIATKQMDSILYQFEHVIHQLSTETSNQTMTVGDIEIFCPQDKTTLWAWNRMDPPAVESCVHEVFREQAAAYPNATSCLRLGC